MMDAMRLRTRRAPGYTWVSVACTAVAALTIYLLVSGLAFYGMAIVSLGVAAVAPRWLLLGGAIVLRFLLPDFTLGGQLIPSDLLLAAYIGRQLYRVAPTAPRVLQEPHVRWLLAFLMWAWLSMAVVGSWSTGLALGRITLYALVFIIATTDDEVGPPLLRLLTIYAVVEAIMGVGGITARNGIRLLGSYGDPHQFGLLMLTGLAGTVAFPRKVRFVLFPILLLGLAGTFTRGLWLATAVGMLVMFVPHIGRRRLLLLAVAASLLAVFLVLEPLITQRFELDPGSSEFRVQTIDLGLAQIQAHPLFGVGWAVGTLHLSDEIQAPYNLWVNVAASTGVLGAILFTVFLFLLARALASSRAHAARVGLVFLSGFLVLSLGEMLLYANAPTSTIAFFILTGVGVAAARRNASQEGAFGPGGSEEELIAREPLPAESRIPGGPSELR